MLYKQPPHAEMLTRRGKAKAEEAARKAAEELDYEGMFGTDDFANPVEPPQEVAPAAGDAAVAPAAAPKAKKKKAGKANTERVRVTRKQMILSKLKVLAKVLLPMALVIAPTAGLFVAKHYWDQSLLSEDQSTLLQLGDGNDEHNPEDPNDELKDDDDVQDDDGEETQEEGDVQGYAYIDDYNREEFVRNLTSLRFRDAWTPTEQVSFFNSNPTTQTQSTPTEIPTPVLVKDSNIPSPTPPPASANLTLALVNTEIDTNELFGSYLVPVLAEMSNASKFDTAAHQAFATMMQEPFVNMLGYGDLHYEREDVARQLRLYRFYADGQTPYGGAITHRRVAVFNAIQKIFDSGHTAGPILSNDFNGDTLIPDRITPKNKPKAKDDLISQICKNAMQHVSRTKPAAGYKFAKCMWLDDGEIVLSPDEYWLLMELNLFVAQLHEKLTIFNKKTPSPHWPIPKAALYNFARSTLQEPDLRNAITAVHLMRLTLTGVTDEVMRNTETFKIIYHLCHELMAQHNFDKFRLKLSKEPNKNITALMTCELGHLITSKSVSPPTLNSALGVAGSAVEAVGSLVLGGEEGTQIATPPAEGTGVLGWIWGTIYLFLGSGSAYGLAYLRNSYHEFVMIKNIVGGIWWVTKSIAGGIGMVFKGVWYMLSSICNQIAMFTTLRSKECNLGTMAAHMRKYQESVPKGAQTEALELAIRRLEHLNQKSRSDPEIDELFVALAYETLVANYKNLNPNEKPGGAIYKNATRAAANLKGEIETMIGKKEESRGGALKHSGASKSFMEADYTGAHGHAQLTALRELRKHSITILKNLAQHENDDKRKRIWEAQQAEFENGKEDDKFILDQDVPFLSKFLSRNNNGNRNETLRFEVEKRSKKSPPKEQPSKSPKSREQSPKKQPSQPPATPPSSAGQPPPAYKKPPATPPPPAAPAPAASAAAPPQQASASTEDRETLWKNPSQLRKLHNANNGGTKYAWLPSYDKDINEIFMILEARAQKGEISPYYFGNPYYNVLEKLDDMKRLPERWKFAYAEPLYGDEDDEE